MGGVCVYNERRVSCGSSFNENSNEKKIFLLECKSVSPDVSVRRLDELLLIFIFRFFSLVIGISSIRSNR